MHFLITNFSWELCSISIVKLIVNVTPLLLIYQRWEEEWNSREMYWGREESLSEIKKERRKAWELFRWVKWLSVEAIYLGVLRWQEWAGVRYHSSAEEELQIYLFSVSASRPAICPSVCLSAREKKGGLGCRGGHRSVRKENRWEKNWADGWLKEKEKRDT